MFWKRLFRRGPRPVRFLKLICDQASFAQAGLEALQAYVKAPSEASSTTVRKAEKDAAYDLLLKAADGRERSPLLSPTIDMILELQANPS